MILTSENYFSQEANLTYMSASQFKAFMDCEAAAMAELTGQRAEKETTALLVGSYVDAHFDGTADAFLEAHPQMYKSDGQLKAEFAHAHTVIERIERDALFARMLSGRKQVIMTGRIAGIPFKIKIDSLLDCGICQDIAGRFPGMAELMFANSAIVDLKVMKDLKSVWKAGEGRVSFVEAWRYDLSMAIYQAIHGSHAPCYIAAASKEATPDIALLSIPQSVLDMQHCWVHSRVSRYARIKSGEIEPAGCGSCAWCRSHKKLFGAVDYRDYEAGLENEAV